MKNKIKWYILFSVLAVLFILVPYPASNLHIQIQFDEISGDKCMLYYATDSSGVITADQYVTAEIDDNTVDFCLDKSLADHITQLRVDFPAEEQIVCIRRITVSSAGVIKLDYIPSDFFTDGNMVQQNDINEIDLVPSRSIAYISTAASDPYVLLSDQMTPQITSCFSHYRLTRFFVCFFVLIVIISVRRNRFPEDLLSASHS